MEEDKMGFERLYKNLIDIIKEEQAKLGFRREAIRLYYPLSSLNHFFETEYSEEEMLNKLQELPDFIKETLGDIKVTSKKERFCFHIPEEDIVVEEINNGEFDYLIRFPKENEDPYYYCFHDEGCHIIYHRFLPADYEDFDF